MIAIQLINTLPIIQKLMGLNLPIKKAYKIYTLAKLINDKRDFFINEEKKIIDKFDGNLTESGNIIFKDEEISNIARNNDLSQFLSDLEDCGEKFSRDRAPLP